ncbi:hypothetical protein COO60DRAFT_1587813 [Scenedesmus sp. NREL 46B-D3]|nr:hypothetical protein COO60DRAFT_1587813 [Scenedesmus sp. NREL 46B-D3]
MMWCLAVTAWTTSSSAWQPSCARHHRYGDTVQQQQQCLLWRGLLSRTLPSYQRCTPGSLSCCQSAATPTRTCC